jgi:putative ABC transport system permease protein
LKSVIRAFLRYLLRRRSLTILQLLGVACGVAAVIGMTLSARSALSSFNRAVEFLRGKATHVLQRPAGPLEESLAAKLIDDPAVERFSPVIDRKVRLPSGELVRLLGLDPFLDRYVRPELSQIHLAAGRGTAAENFLSFLLQKDSVLIDNTLASQLGLKAGGQLATSVGIFRIIATFPNPSGEPLILIDIAHAQDLFGLTGYVDRIDLLITDEESFRSRWEQGFKVESNRQRRETLAALLGAFKLNLQALSLLALFVGVFLIYNTSMFTVVSRRRDAGILRSLGARRSEILAAFLTEILILGCIGGAVGGILGYGLSLLLTGLVGDTISSLYFFLRPTPLPWSWINMLAGIILGCSASLLGSIESLVELVRVEPIKALRGRVVSVQGPSRARLAALAGLVVMLISLVLLIFSEKHVYIGFAGAFAFMLGASLMAGLIILLIAPALKRLFGALSGLAGRVAASSITQNMSRTGVAVAAFMVALSMSIGLGSMIESFRQSLIWWMNSQLRGELYISTKADVEVPEVFYEELKGLPGIGGVDPYRNVQITYRNSPVNITAISADILKKYGRFGWMSGNNASWNEVKQGAVLVSESFARKFGIRKGDAVDIKGSEGIVTLPVAGVIYDYTTEHGLVMMDRETYIAIFKDRTINSLGIFLDQDNPARQQVLDEVRRRASIYGLPVVSRAQLHRNILSLFDNTFAITRSMRILAIIVAFFGITGALMTIYAERQREFGILRALGFSTRQIGTMTVLEGIGIGMIAYCMSVAVGTLLSVILIKVINLRSFNWTIFYHFSLGPYVVAALTAFLASVAASLYPLWKVYRTYPQMQIREE